MPMKKISDLAVGRDNNFNLIRLFAASGVLVSHAWPISLGPDAVQPLTRILHGTTLGTVCVYVFFAISGFFIAQSFDRSRTRIQFIAARVLRLFPALIVTLMLTLLAGVFLTEAPLARYLAAAPEYFLRNVTLVFLQYDLPGVFQSVPYGPPINGSLWTLAYEVACYFGVFLAGVAGLLRRPVFVGVVVALMLWSIFGADIELPSEKLNKLFDLGLPFAIGSALYLLRASIPVGVLPTLALWVVAALLWTTPVFHAAFVLALSYTSLVAGWARIPPLLAYNRLGDYSYGMYIYAFPLQQLAAHFGALTPTQNIATALVMTVPIAVLSWHLIEEPALRLKSRFSAGAAPLPRAR